MAYPAYRPTPARMAALKKAQAASAAKRRGTGKGKLAAANRKNISYKKAVRRARIRSAVTVGTAVAVAAGAHFAGKAIAKKQSNQRRGMKHTNYAAMANKRNLSAKRQAFMKHTAPKVASGRANRHNRYFVASRHGGVSVRKHGN